MKANPDQLDDAGNPASRSMVAPLDPTDRLTGDQSMESAQKHYFLERAEAELERANEATHESAARAHYYLAGFYLDRAHNGAANEN